MIAIQMVSEEFGTELFKYETESERMAGLFRLMRKIESLNDVIERVLSFGEIDDNGDFSSGEVVAVRGLTSWNCCEYEISDDPMHRVLLENDDGKEICEFYSSEILAHNEIQGIWADQKDLMEMENLIEDYALWAFKRQYGDMSEYHVELL